ncbi:MAG: hypothetical protein RL748_2985 [Pseudomonadota bacterium]
MSKHAITKFKSFKINNLRSQLSNSGGHLAMWKEWGHLCPNSDPAVTLLV